MSTANEASAPDTRWPAKPSPPPSAEAIRPYLGFYSGWLAASVPPGTAGFVSRRHHELERDDVIKEFVRSWAALVDDGHATNKPGDGLKRILRDLTTQKWFIDLGEGLSCDVLGSISGPVPADADRLKAAMEALGEWVAPLQVAESIVRTLTAEQVDPVVHDLPRALRAPMVAKNLKGYKQTYAIAALMEGVADADGARSAAVDPDIQRVAKQWLDAVWREKYDRLVQLCNDEHPGLRIELSNWVDAFYASFPWVSRPEQPEMDHAEWQRWKEGVVEVFLSEWSPQRPVYASLVATFGDDLVEAGFELAIGRLQRRKPSRGARYYSVYQEVTWRIRDVVRAQANAGAGTDEGDTDGNGLAPEADPLVSALGEIALARLDEFSTPQSFLRAVNEVIDECGSGALPDDNGELRRQYHLAVEQYGRGDILIGVLAYVASKRT